MMLDLIGGVSEQLPPEVNASLAGRFVRLRTAVRAARTASTRSACEARLERFLHSSSYLSDAAWRYLTPKATSALASASAAIETADAIIRAKPPKKT